MEGVNVTQVINQNTHLSNKNMGLWEKLSGGMYMTDGACIALVFQTLIVNKNNNS